MKRVVLIALLCAACIPAVEQHGGIAPIPSKMPDAGFAGAGVVVDGGLQLAHVPFAARVLATVAVALCVRNCSTFGRSVDSGVLMIFGAIPTEIVGQSLHYLKHPTHPNCYKYVGPDTMVTQPVQLKAIDGQMWNGECLSWDEVRRLRHSP